MVFGCERFRVVPEPFHFYINNCIMSERYVYIDAPTLDNSDQSKLSVNDDFKFVSAGQGDSVAHFPLYEKFNVFVWKSSLESDGLLRKEFKSGLWGLKNSVDADGDDDVNNGGDYISANTTQVHISNFIVGKLTKFRFRFYKKEEITVENRENNFIHNEIENYSEVPRVYILETAIENDKAINSYKVVGIANWAGNNEYVLDRDYYISGKKLKTNNFALVFVFISSTSTISVDENKSYAFSELRNFAGAESDEGNRVGLRSIPRGTLDNRSYIVRLKGENDGINNGQNRLLDFDYYIENDLVEEYLAGASSKHHLSTLDIESLNTTIKYSAPRINAIDYNRKSTAAYYAYISHNSLSRNNIFALIGEDIDFIQIPFIATMNGDTYENGSTMITNQFTSGVGGLWHTNRTIWIAQGNTKPADIVPGNDALNKENGWIKTNEVICFSYFDGPGIYKATPESKLTYKGGGLWIAAIPPDKESGKSTFAVHYFENESGIKYSNNPEDKIYSTNSTFNATPYIRVIFNYKLRGDWFDYIESLAERVSSLETALTNHLS